jgi:thiamine-phosphate pyrophosphorylase
VLLDGRAATEEFSDLATELMQSGADIIQLRDKLLPDRELLQRARCLRSLTSGSQTLMIINDRPDIAMLTQADGVHLGQDEIPVEDARQLLGPDALIGVSTHTIQQARQAVLAGADYLGCGPTFPSATKSFEHFAGLEFLRQVHGEIRIPSFAIGGIDNDNLQQVTSTGFYRIAVQNAVTNVEYPSSVLKRMRKTLLSSSPSNEQSPP